MGTKRQPGQYDAYDKAELDEPFFTLLARDASAPQLISMWADMREKHGEEAAVVAEARECAEAMRAWRDHNRPKKVDTHELQAALIAAQGDRIRHLEEALDRSETARKEAVDRVDHVGPGFHSRQEQAGRVADDALMRNKSEQSR